MKKVTAEWWQNTIVANPFLWDETIMGIDWGESTNAWAVVSYRGQVLDQGAVAETPRGLDALLTVLREYAHPVTGELPKVAIETPRRLLVTELARAGVVVVPLNPKAVRLARGYKNPRNQSKTDAKDAVLIANVYRNNPSYYGALHGPTEAAKAVTLLYRQREQAIRQLMRQAHQVRSALAEYHPNAAAAFTVEQMADNLAPYWVLIDALTPAQGARLRADGIASRMMKPGGRKSTKDLDKRAEEIRTALRKPYLTYPTEFEAAYAETVRTQLEILRTMVEHRALVETRLNEKVHAHPYWTMFSEAHGAAEGVVAGLIAEMGDDPARFADHDALAAFTGSAPAIDQSGNRAAVHRRDVKGNRLHKAMWHWAESVPRWEPAAKHYYWTIRSRGSSHAHATRKVINKLLRGVHMCVRTGSVWDDSQIWRTDLTTEQIDAFAEATKADIAQRRKNRLKAAGMTPAA